MDNLVLHVLTITLLVVVSASSGTVQNKRFHITSHKNVQATISSGYTQIMSANLSPKCKEIALNDLQAAKASADEMTCNTTWENIEDYAEIIDEACGSVSALLTDLNTFANGIPGCFSNNHWYNFISITTCLGAQVKGIWKGVKDFWNFSDYWMDTVNVIKEYSQCLKDRKKKAVESVKHIVDMSKLCQ